MVSMVTAMCIYLNRRSLLTHGDFFDVSVLIELKTPPPAGGTVLMNSRSSSSNSGQTVVVVVFVIVVLLSLEIRAWMESATAE